MDVALDQRLTTLEIDSASSALGNLVSPANLDGPYDSVRADNLLKVNLAEGFGSISFGEIMRPNLSEQFLHG